MHGWSLDHRYELIEYEPIFQARTGWQRIYLDLPGMGQTIAPPWLANLDQMLEIVLMFIDRADHLLPIEQTALFRILVHDWLDRVEEYRQT